MEQIAAVIGKRLRARREALGLTQVELAALVGVSQATISGWERGEYCPARRHEAGLTRALHAVGLDLFDTTGVAA